MLTVMLAITQTVYAQIESSNDVQDSSGDETITESNSFTKEPTQEANVECGEGATCTVSQHNVRLCKTAIFLSRMGLSLVMK